MLRHPLTLTLLLALIAAGAALALGRLWPAPERAPAQSSAPRMVSLMPPITETLYDIGAGELLVGRSDWCDYPAAARALPACGSAQTPNLEAIARLEPTLILANRAASTAADKLTGLAPAHLLPWLTAEDVIAGTRELGRLTGREQAADALADELQAALTAAPPADGPRVLLAMSYGGGRLESVTFLRRNSLHGAALHAAGARNAADFDVAGLPELSIERVIELDPDAVILLSVRSPLPPAEREQLLAQWRALTALRAAREGRVAVLDGAHLLGAGRRVLQLVEDLRQEVTRLGG
jgi:ABC-type Fe3+-hydroxamate transport system substrate-binding protein